MKNNAIRMEVKYILHSSFYILHLIYFTMTFLPFTIYKPGRVMLFTR